MSGSFSHLRYVAVDGPIGVGKTTFAHLLADKIDAHLILENASDNPFLEGFYHDRKRYAFQTQCFFLLSRYAQQKDLLGYDLFMRQIVTDYTFAKDFLFASVNLPDAELALYSQISDLLKKNIPQPDLVVFLTASVEVLLQRIKRRNINYEMDIDAEYLEQIVDSYNYHFFHYNSTPLLVIKTDELDFVENTSHLEEIFNQIAEMRAGTRYFSPGEEFLGM